MNMCIYIYAFANNVPPYNSYNECFIIEEISLPLHKESIARIHACQRSEAAFQ